MAFVIALIKSIGHKPQREWKNSEGADHVSLSAFDATFHFVYSFFLWHVLTSSEGANFLSFQCCTYLPCSFDDSPCLLLDAWHIWIGGVYQRCDLSGPYKAVLGQWPAQIQSWSSHFSLHWPVSVRGAVDCLTWIMVHQLWHAGCPDGYLNSRLNEFYF